MRRRDRWKSGTQKLADTFNRAFGDVIVFFSQITERPRQPAGGNLRMHFVLAWRSPGKLDIPHHPRRVLHLHFRFGADDLFLDECEGRPWRLICAPDAPVEVLRTDRARIAPEDRRALWFFNRLGFCLRRSRNDGKRQQWDSDETG